MEDNCISKIQVDNKSILSCKFSNLLNYSIIIPNIQRLLDTQKIIDIITYQLEYYKNNETYNFLGLINIHKCKENGNYYLTDGQHRWNALKQLYNDYSHNPNIIIELIKVDTLYELENNYNIINKNTPLPEFPNFIDKNIPEETCSFFKKKYPNFWSQSTRPKRPNLNMNQFQESLGYICKKINISSIDELIELVSDKNDKLIKNQKYLYEDIGNYTLTMINKCNQYNFFLGLDVHSNNEYGYLWASQIITSKTGEIFKQDIKRRKKKIPHKLKKDSWYKYIGEDILKRNCIVCNINELRNDNFEAGHIISEYNGGVISIDNIIPICSQCNKSMSSRNVDDYIKEFYPNNYENYLKMCSIDNSIKLSNRSLLNI